MVEYFQHYISLPPIAAFFKAKNDVFFESFALGKRHKQTYLKKKEIR